MIKLKSYAKLNLYLDIGEKLDNGYHNIETIFQTINLFDEINIEKLDEPEYRIICNNPEVPVGEESIVYRAIEIMMKGRNKGVAVSIDKKIPLASGLGGGSSNVASILLGICNLFQTKVSISQLIIIATSLGMDIPFFIERGTVYARGRGEVLFPLTLEDRPIHLILVNPGIAISTKWAYQAFDEDKKDDLNKPSLDINRYLSQKEMISVSKIRKYIYNRFDSIICKKYPLISEIKSQLIELGALSATISGSGPTVYGVMEDEQKADEVYKKLKNQYPFVYKSKTIRAKNIFI
ncbi:MAG TPA: 4-(cytidine 5'-diphospho)-2-C-methyl-D-erythritol kinase [Atribacterota bacterium]|nr:4-(cytidine 5'-diphospho)-2-C-methyl-D-erythritol kinase [Atribacterota bacterium]